MYVLSYTLMGVVHQQCMYTECILDSPNITSHMYMMEIYYSLW